MFGNKKAIVVNVVNKKDLEKSEEELKEHIDPNFGAHVYVIMNNMAYWSAIIMGTYFAADTIRHCVIHTVAVRVQPPVIVEAAKAASNK